MNIKTVIGRIGNKEFPEDFLQYNSGTKEMIPTAKKNTQKKFEALGFNQNEVIFDE